MTGATSQLTIHATISPASRDQHSSDFTPSSRNDGIVVILMCGLPGCGKSSLIRAVQAKSQEERLSSSSLHDDVPLDVMHVEYDMVQSDIIASRRMTNDQRVTHGGVDDTSDDNVTVILNDELEAWHQSRRKALDVLRQQLSELQSTPLTLYHQNQQEPSSPNVYNSNDTIQSERTKLDVIFMDDNFYWKSMRKQVYHVCQAEVQTTDRKRPLFYGTIHVDTPLDMCLARNDKRPDHKIVLIHVIQRMHEKFESPILLPELSSSKNCAWEQPESVLVLDGSKALECNVGRIVHFVRRLVHNSVHVVVPAVDTGLARDREEKRVQQARFETMQSVHHEADQLWRQCVSCTVRLRLQSQSDWGKRVNQVRKHCLRQLKAIRMECFDANTCLELFLEGLPTDSGTCDWLSEKEKKRIRREITAL